MKGIVSCFLTALFWCAAPAAAQDDGKALVERTCSKCHSLTSTLKQRNTAEAWSAIVDDMIGRGAEGSDADFEKIINYLAKNFGPRVKVNKASAQELAGALEIPLATAEAVIEHRARHGSFKSFEDLKSAPALEGKNIEDKKDRLDFAAPQ
jgi:competence protein ComEA